jgi:hypothetical protein
LVEEVEEQMVIMAPALVVEAEPVVLELVLV